MDGRDAMLLSGPASYYMHRGLAGPASGLQPGLHGPPGMRSLSNPNQTLPVQSSNVGGGGSIGAAFQVESPSFSQHDINVSGQGGGMPQGEPVKRKRGRPRKYGPDGSVSLALSPMSSSTLTPGSGMGSGSVLGSGSAASMQKRGRGRPPGTGRKQQLASFGEWISSSAGMGFTPHIIMISVGEDIASKIMSFSQQSPRAVCILSANGAVSTVTLRQPATSGGTVTYEVEQFLGNYILGFEFTPLILLHHFVLASRSHHNCLSRLREKMIFDSLDLNHLHDLPSSLVRFSPTFFKKGEHWMDVLDWCRLRGQVQGGGENTMGRFEILCLSGSYLLTDNGGSRSRSGGLSISLSSPDGRVIGGGVGGLLIAASPVQVIVGSFIYGGAKPKKNKSKTGSESGGEPDLPMGDKQMTLSGTPPNQNLNPVLSGWPGSRQMDMRNAHMDIDLTSG